MKDKTQNNSGGPGEILRTAGVNFRNYQYLDVNFFSNWVILIGPNGAGKTNFLELITLVVRGMNIRGKLRDVVQWEKQESLLSVEVKEGTLGARISKQQESAKKENYWQGKKSAVPFDISLPVILFLPQEDSLLDSAAGRRKLLGRALALQSAGYYQRLLQYYKVLKQRNSFLKRFQQGLEQESALESWTASLTNLAAPLWRERIDFFSFLDSKLPGLLKKLGLNNNLPRLRVNLGGMKKNSIPTTAEILERFSALKPLEVERGCTLIGPHRDQINFVVDKSDVVPYLSRGQRRILLLTLHILEGEYAADSHRHPPLYLLDDIFGELDPFHRNAVLSYLNGRQAIATSADPALADIFSPRASLYQVESGKIEPMRKASFSS